MTYAAAGVDIDAGERAVELIRPLAARTHGPDVIGGLGGFGGSFALGPGRYRDPVLVASSDGVGTKLALARQAGGDRLASVGIDLVAMCVDDVVCQGAKPLFLLDYIAVGRLDPLEIESIVAGVAEGCRLAGCALLGGETAEHPGVMAVGDVELAGFAVGVVERDRMIDGAASVRAGDVVVGLLSGGLRSNGYSLARAVLLERAGLRLEEPAPWSEAGGGAGGRRTRAGGRRTLADELLAPSVIYTPAVLGLVEAVEVRGLAHITGGGLVGNLPRAMPPTCDAVLARGSWETPPVFGEIQRRGEVTDAEMARVFNLGLGMVVIVGRGSEGEAVRVLEAAGVRATVVGEIVAGTGTVRFTAPTSASP